jgi:trk system potassium uptake protein TrkA
MRIVIVGAGLVGSTLADRLSRDGHDVAIVDQDAARIRALADGLDAQVVEANGATAAALRQARNERADRVGAPSDVDEVNLMVGMLAASLFDIPRIIVRLRDSAHEEAFALIHAGRSGDHVSINPDAAAVDRIAALLEVPGAVDVVSFMDDRLVVAGFRIKEEADLVGVQVSDMNLLFADTPALAVAIHRRDDWLVPHGGEQIEVGDLVYFAIAREHLSDVLTLLGVAPDRRGDVMIAGAGPIGLQLAKRLEATDVDTVLVEHDAARAFHASEVLRRTMVIRGEVTDRALLEQEGIDRISTFVAVTEDHETNLVAGLLAKRLGAGRAVVLVDNVALVDLVSEIGIDAIISPRVLVIGFALEHIRGRRVRSVAQLLEDQIEIVEAEAASRSGPLCADRLADLKLPRGVLVAALRRGEKLVVPQGDDRIEPGDRVLFITTTENAAKLADFLAG